MGYAVFAARKIMLTTKINNLNFKIMALSQQQQNLSQLSSNMQQGFGMQSMMMGGMGGMNGLGMFGSMLGGMGGMFGMGSSIFGGYGNDWASMCGYNMNNYAYQQQLNNMQQMMLKPVAMMENQIECQRKTLETQVKAAQTELESVEKAEEKAIQSSAPKFA